MEQVYKIILMFFFYSFGGWVIEVVYTRVTTGKLINRGFLTGPLCPIWGVGGTLVPILLSKYKEDILILFFMSIIIAGTLEYFTSFIMEKIFKNRWWDYSEMKFNINGRVCLETMMPFGLIALLAVYIINPFILGLISKLSMNVLAITSTILSILTIIDTIVSFNIIITLKQVSSTIKTDSTEVITKKVREILLSKTPLHRRLVESFPDMKIFNKAAILKNKLKKTKKKLKLEKKKQKKRKNK